MKLQLMASIQELQEMVLGPEHQTTILMNQQPNRSSSQVTGSSTHVNQGNQTSFSHVNDGHQPDHIFRRLAKVEFPRYDGKFLKR
uniref:Uncharacterized protein n=1 Tax=Rhizophora mucronata TaxID=61149 RepID=A0A2P2QPG8_RHIMU